MVSAVRAGDWDSCRRLCDTLSSLPMGDTRRAAVRAVVEHEGFAATLADTFRPGSPRGWLRLLLVLTAEKGPCQQTKEAEEMPGAADDLENDVFGPALPASPSDAAPLSGDTAGCSGAADKVRRAVVRSPKVGFPTGNPKFTDGKRANTTCIKQLKTNALCFPSQALDCLAHWLLDGDAETSCASEAVAVCHRLITRSRGDLQLIARHRLMMRGICRALSSASRRDDGSLDLVLRSISHLGANNCGVALRRQGCLQMMLPLVQVKRSEAPSPNLWKVLTSLLCIFNNEYDAAIPLTNKLIEATAVPQWWRLLHEDTTTRSTSPSLLFNVRMVLRQLHLASKQGNVPAAQVPLCATIATPVEAPGAAAIQEAPAYRLPTKQEHPRATAQARKRQLQDCPGHTDIREASLRMTAFWTRAIVKKKRPLAVQPARLLASIAS